MKDISPLFERKLIIWGMGGKGSEILEEIICMGAGKKGILLCDSDAGLQGKEILNNIVLSPRELKEVMQNMELSSIAVLITVASLKAQDEIINEVENACGKYVDIYTLYGIQWGMYLGLKNTYVSNAFREKKIIEHERNQQNMEAFVNERERCLKYFAFLPLHNDEIILLYQPGKVASTSIYVSAQKYHKNILHCHNLNSIGEDEESLRRLLDLKSAKIICLVRDPVARQIAAMWQNIPSLDRYSAQVDFSEIEEFYFADEQFDKKQFRWFESQMKKLIKIDVFAYPFDKEKGYSIIKDGNIELLLIKMEKLNDLENVIGDFLNIEQFYLCKENVGEEKPYRFALREYKENFYISNEQLDRIYKKEGWMKHFYTEKERMKMYMRWMKNSVI